MDYVGMAKCYREEARKQGLLQTLEEKAKTTPVIKRYLENVLFRFPAWNPDKADAVMADLKKVREMGFGINFFFPKFAAAPAYNWLPMPGTDMPIADWDSDEAKARFQGLKRWCAYHKAVGASEMVSHAFVDGDYQKQRIEFACGVTVDLDMGQDLCRIKGVEGYSGQWEKPADHLGDYAIAPEEDRKVEWS